MIRSRRPIDNQVSTTIRLQVRNDVEPMDCDEDEFMNDDDDEDNESEDVEPAYESEDKEASEEDEDDGIQVVRQSITSEVVGDRGKEVVGDRGKFTPNVLVSHQLLIIDPVVVSNLFRIRPKRRP
ncbi:hypothetical protein L6452_01140 [Arctium lappa]|uniref:Uncharacterized protein n=1 Tax=Arctium lappa TaxID=4217 RepID=A0ACB9FGP4_ARCLA|nr:hypothetical protein L6452_01140 [Arctium lappa]